ncbi:hypothetical protein SUDANB145_07290 (plasmid) [Streptomyces sp. enrichment culture]|uniref:hypothetical protein n=1 Tax=Streptomyces sp. enrichment culture TaxID=1795815 RepID=UPI003F56390A
MATALMSPYVGGDEIKVADAVELLRETGHPIAQRTLERQSKARHVTFVRRGRANYASWSALLRVHAAWVDAQDAGV